MLSATCALLTAYACRPLHDDDCIDYKFGGPAARTYTTCSNDGRSIVRRKEDCDDQRGPFTEDTVYEACDAVERCVDVEHIGPTCLVPCTTDDECGQTDFCAYPQRCLPRRPEGASCFRTRDCELGLACAPEATEAGVHAGDEDASTDAAPAPATMTCQRAS